MSGASAYCTKAEMHRLVTTMVTEKQDSIHNLLNQMALKIADLEKRVIKLERKDGMCKVQQTADETIHLD